MGFAINDTTNFQINSTGYLTNKTSLVGGAYHINITINDTVGNINSTVYTVNVQANGNILTLTSLHGWNYPYWSGTNLSCTAQGGTANLYVNGTALSNPFNGIFGAGTYNISCNTTGDANYGTNSTYQILTITPTNSLVYTYINNSRANLTIQKGTSVWLNGTRVTGGVDAYLYNNGTLINVGINMGNYTLFSNVGLYNISTIYSGVQNFTSSYETWWLNVTCTQNLQNTTVSDWYGGVCSGYNLNQTRNYTTYDANDCGTYTNTTFYEYNLTLANVTSTPYNDWSNLTCSGNQMNQSRSHVYYDANNLGCFVNYTDYDYQLVGPTYQNTTFGNWTNTCQGANLNQSRNLTSYDIFGCAMNITYFEYNYTAANLTYSYTSWSDLTCINQTTRNQTRNQTQYDSNNLGCFSNITTIQYQSITDAACDTLPPTWTSLNNKTCYVNSTCSHQITATDAWGISSYALNDTSVFNISSTGAITNITINNVITTYWFNANATDPNGRSVSGIFYINVTARPVVPTGSSLCRYRKFGYWNNNLNYFPDSNCI